MARCASVAPRLYRILNTPERRARIDASGNAKRAVAELLAQCHPKQRAFVADEGREIAALCGRGGGKTTGGRARFLRRMLTTPRARCLYIATTRTQAEEFMWGPLKLLNARLKLGAHFAEQKLKMTLPNGAELRLVGADDKREIEKYRGQPFHEVQIDEAASHTVQILNWLIERIIGPRLGDFDGTIVMYGTPGHILSGDFYESTRAQSETSRPYDERNDEQWSGWEGGWSTHCWTAKDGADAGIPAMEAVWRRALITKRRRGWEDDNPVWKREYLAIWSADDTQGVFRYRPHTEEGAEWNQWDPERDEMGFAKMPPGDWLYTFGMDMGHKDPFALQVFGHNAVSSELLHAYEFEKAGMSVRDIAVLLVGENWVRRVLRGQDPGRAGGVIGVTGWPYGIEADTAGSGGAIIQELNEVYGINVEEAPRRPGEKLASIELANSDLVDGRIKILKGSILEHQLLHLQWAVDIHGVLKEDKAQRNDCTDAFVYCRRRAMHLIGDQPSDPGPDSGSAEATEQWLADNAEAIATRGQKDEWSDMFADAGYDEDW